MVFTRASTNEHEIGGHALAFFTKNEREWITSPLNEEVINRFNTQCKESGYTAKQTLPHAGYPVNLDHPDKFQREHSRVAMINELERCMDLGMTILNVHQGSDLGFISVDACLVFISETEKELGFIINAGCIYMILRVH